MTISNISSAYLASALLPAVRQTQSQLATLQVESASGQYADLGLQLGSQSGYELSLRTQDDLLGAMTTANAITGSDMTTAQDALSSILSSAQSVAKSLATVQPGSDDALNLQSLGQSSLQQFVALSNTTGASGYVFGGDNTQTAPIADYFAQPTSTAKTNIDKAFQSYFGFAVGSPQSANITLSQMQSFLSGPFASQFQSPAWGGAWSNASSVNTSVEIAPGQTIDSSTNANSPGFQSIAQGYAMLSEFANSGLGSGALAAVTTAAQTAISGGAAAIVGVQGQLGEAQSQVTQANSEMSNQMTLLQTQINGLDNVDPAEIATQLTTLSTQLETAYQLTSQIHNLTLAQYLPT